MIFQLLMNTLDLIWLKPSKNTGTNTIVNTNNTLFLLYAHAPMSMSLVFIFRIVLFTRLFIHLTHHYLNFLSLIFFSLFNLMIYTKKQGMSLALMWFKLACGKNRI